MFTLLLSFSLLLGALVVPGHAQTARVPYGDVDLQMKAFTQRASQDELDALARRRRMPPSERQSDDARQRRQRETATPPPAESDAVQQARRAIACLREHKSCPPPTAPEDPLTVALAMCELLGETAVIVMEARQAGFTASALIHTFQRGKTDAMALRAITRVVTRIFQLPRMISPQEASEVLFTSCMQDPMAWADTSASGWMRY